ncbi:MAG TPA: prephenate dehydratase [Vicinamibacteria bacterium]|nr:prephenate dehydratase [Vicinamibacteria bacterium]
MSDPGYAAAYQGAPGAFSEDAARALVGDKVPLLPCWKFEDVFLAVESGQAAHGVLPIENTLAGSVQASYDLLAERSLTIVGETVRRIRHALLAPRGAQVPALRQVLSHPVALAQCEGFFRRHAHIEPVPVYDTAGAVERVVREGRTEQGAIASRRAADLYGADVLEESVEDHPENYTRFLLVTTAARASAAASASPRASHKTSLVFRVANRPGALVECLGHFASRGVDLAKIESRPLRGRPFEYMFYLDLIGDAADSSVAEALAGLRRSTTMLRILGSYPRDLPKGA